MYQDIIRYKSNEDIDVEIKIVESCLICDAKKIDEVHQENLRDFPHSSANKGNTVKGQWKKDL